MTRCKTKIVLVLSLALACLFVLTGCCGHRRTGREAVDRRACSRLIRRPGAPSLFPHAFDSQLSLFCGRGKHPPARRKNRGRPVCRRTQGRAVLFRPGSLSGCRPGARSFSQLCAVRHARRCGTGSPASGGWDLDGRRLA